MCADESTLLATTTCMTYLSGVISMPRLFQTTSQYVAGNLIDHTDNLEKARIYAYSGKLIGH
jgi:hypothetical protein